MLKQRTRSFWFLFIFLMVGGLALPAQAIQPTNVELSAYTLTAVSNGVRIDWRTETEMGTVGYVIKRRDLTANSQEYIMLENVGDDGFVEAIGGIAPATYSELDETAVWGTVYAYQLVEVEANSDLKTIAEEQIIFGDVATATNTPTPTATTASLNPVTNTPTNTPIPSNNTATATSQPTATATRQATTTPTPAATATQIARSTATATVASANNSNPTLTPTTGNAATTNSNTVLAQSDDANNDPYPAPEATAVLPTPEPSIEEEAYPASDDLTSPTENSADNNGDGRTADELQLITTPLAPVEEGDAQIVPYPSANQATATPINLPVIGGQTNNPTNATDDGTQGQLFLWAGFIIALLIFIVAVFGAILIFTRQRG